MPVLNTIRSPQKRAVIRPQLRQAPSWFELVELIFLGLAIYTLANLLSVRFVVDGPSMTPTFKTGQFLLVSRMNYIFGSPQRGDIMVFHLANSPQVDFIKRVIGLPSEVVEFRDTWVYINGQRLDEPYLSEACSLEHCPNGIWQLGVDEYFVLGDNRNQSADSRYFGAINREYIIGEAVLRYWSLSDFGWIARTGIIDE